MLKIGSHVSMSGKEMMLGSVKEALSYNATTFMFYTGAPQNTARKPIEQLRIDEAKALMKEHHINIDDVVVHAPYIINLGNAIKPETFELAVSFLAQEIKRCEAIGVSRLVLHPGSHVKAGEDVGLDKIVEGLNLALKDNTSVHIALETMAGKGSELGKSFEQLKYIMDHTIKSELLGVCLDTCHLYAAGYQIESRELLYNTLNEFDKQIGIKKIRAIHLNNTKVELGKKVDRHSSIFDGNIGLETFEAIVCDSRFDQTPIVLEPPSNDTTGAEQVEYLQKVVREKKL